MSKLAVNLAGISLASALAIGLVATADAQLMTQKSLSLGMATTIAQTAIATCKSQGYNVSAHVVGRNGEVLVAMRGDGTAPHTMENSMKKAYTSRTLRIPSGQFAANVKGNPTAGQLFLTNSCRRKAPCRSWSARTRLARSASRALRAATRTRPAPRPVSTASRPT